MEVEFQNIDYVDVVGKRFVFFHEMCQSEVSVRCIPLGKINGIGETELHTTRKVVPLFEDVVEPVRCIVSIISSLILYKML